MTHDAAFEAWVQEARHVKIEAAAEMLGIRVPARGEYSGPCPVGCCDHDGFSINPKKGVFLCRKSGAAGDAIALVQHVRSCEFVEAVEFINGTPRPGRDAVARPRDPAIDKERREEMRDDAIARGKQESAEHLRSIERATALFEQGQTIENTLAVDYLERRGIPSRLILGAPDLRFIPNLSYRGYPHKAGAVDENGEPLPDDEVELGSYHCMIAAVRDAQGRVQGIHRTYIDAGRGGETKPSGQPVKLRPPGDRNRNKAKKGTHRMGGGLILLSEIGETLAVGEGIETALSFLAMAQDGVFGDDFAGVSIAAAYSLGNLCGGSMGTKPHPRPPRGAPNATIMDGEPDMASAAMWIPPQVKRLVLLGDGDSDPAATRAALCTGAERFRRIGLEVFVSIAPDGADFNDVLLARGKVAA